VGSYDYFHG